MVRAVSCGVSRFVYFLAFLFAPVACSQTSARIIAPIENSSRATLPESHLRLLSRAIDAGPLDVDRPLDRIVLLLKGSPEQQQALQTLLLSQQTRGSASYHAWLTPGEFGSRFGPAPGDLAKITDWLQQQGFRVDSVAKSGMWIEFSGTVGQVNAAFQTQMHSYQIDGETHIANAADVSIPAAIAPVVEGVPLHDFFSKPTFVRSRAQQDQTKPQITAPWNGAHAVIPGDFASIYDLNPLYKAGLNGSGQTIAVVAESDVNLSDNATFQKIFGLPSNPPTVIDVGADPGVDTTQGYGMEAAIDTEWSSAVAPGAAIDLVVSAPSETTDGTALSALYIVEQNLAQIVSVSYGECEQNLGTAGNAMWNSLWQQAAAQGISVFVASGDQGSVSCNASGLDLESGYGPMSVNGLASTPFNTAVGGTEFEEGVNGGSVVTFWNTTNAANLASVTGYIPEMVWNDSCDDSYNIYVLQECTSTLPSLAAGGGGVSTLYATPSWQTLSVTGLSALVGYSLPNQSGVSPRGLPDVVLDASADHDGYLLCFTTESATPDCQLTTGAITQTTFQNEAGGTSFGTPAFAGIMAIVNQAQKNANPSPSPSPITDGRQGLANYSLYALAASETFSACNSSNRTTPSQAAPSGCTFNDITYGNNGPPQQYTWAPGVGGYAASAGYDLASGLGSVDARNLVANWSTAGASFHGSQTAITGNGGTNAISTQHGQPVLFDVTVQKLSGDTTSQTPSGNVSLVARGGTLQGSAGVEAEALTAGASGSASTGSFTVDALPGGSYNVTANFPGDETFAASTSNSIPVSVTPESSVTTLSVFTYSGGYGYPVDFNVQVAGASGQGNPTGTVTLANGGTNFATIPLSSNGQAEFNTCMGSGGFFPPPSTMPCFLPGTYQFSATYSGDSSFSPSPSPPALSQLASVTIPKGLTWIPGIGGSSSNPNLINLPYTVSTALETNTQAVAPTGTMQFYLNSTALGSPVPVSGNPARASVANVTFPQGDFTLTANYSGDANYNPTSLVQPSWSGIPLGWIGSATAATINPGQTATFNFTLSNYNYTGQVPIQCVAGTGIILLPGQTPTVPPPGVACAVSPSSVNLSSANQTVPVVVTITSTEQSRASPAPYRTLPFTLPPVLALVFWGTCKRRWRTALGCSAAILAISAIASCGGSSSTTPTAPAGPAATTAVFTIYTTTTTTLGPGDYDTSYDGVTLTVNINP
jgi:large repetitive protein